MTETITDILRRIDKALDSFQKEASFSLTMTSGKLKMNVEVCGSNHEKLILMAEVEKVEVWMRSLPIVGTCGGDWSISGAKRRAWNSSKISREYYCRMMGLDICRPASRRIRTAAEMISGARDRLVEVENNAAAQDLTHHLWQVSAKQRETRKINARSAREAAWTYAALYVRTRAEVRAWHETVTEITQVSQIYPETEWQTSRP